ncbi:MAG: hypothetical protein ACYTEQ_00390 [Planctomycetota bacterium]|jgi:hypothetical protein
MRRERSLLAVAAVLVCCIVLVWFSVSAGVEKRYKIQPQISVPEYKTDAARAIDAYERLMERYMDLTEGNLIRTGTDVQAVLKKLDSIDRKLTRLSARITRIEKALGLELERPAQETVAPKGAGKRSRKRALPPA